MAVPVAVISLITTIASTAVQIDQQNKAQAREKKANQVASRQKAIANNRRIRIAQNDAKVARAALVNEGQAQTGGFNASGVQGGVASTTTQAAGNIGFARQTQAATANINRQLQGAADARGNAALAGAIGGLSSQFGRTLGGDFDTLFGAKASGPTKPIGGSSKNFKKIA